MFLSINQIISRVIRHPRYSTSWFVLTGGVLKNSIVSDVQNKTPWTIPEGHTSDSRRSTQQLSMCWQSHTDLYTHTHVRATEHNNHFKNKYRANGAGWSRFMLIKSTAKSQLVSITACRSAALWLRYLSMTSSVFKTAAGEFISY